jgi:hypothetical protein
MMAVTYEEALRAWVNTWHPLQETDKVRLDARVDTWGGCETCDYGNQSGLKIEVNGVEVRTYDFYSLNTILQAMFLVTEKMQG